jgi:uncharacterized membrane protein
LALALSAAAQTTSTTQRTQKTQPTTTTLLSNATTTGADAANDAATGAADQAAAGGGDKAQATPGGAIAFLGKLHLLAVHFPIALLLAAALAEALTLVLSGGGARSMVAAARYCLWLAAISAIVATALGLANAATGGGADMAIDLARHKWLGIAATVDAVATLVAGELARRHDRRGAWIWAYRVLLLAGAILVAITGHFGGRLAFGPDYLQL